MSPDIIRAEVRIGNHTIDRAGRSWHMEPALIKVRAAYHWKERGKAKHMEELELRAEKNLEVGRIQEERRRLQAEYEIGVQDAIKQLSMLAAGKGWEQIQPRVEEVMESVQNMAFMEGYLYAISILEEGLVKYEIKPTKKQ